VSQERQRSEIVDDDLSPSIDCQDGPGRRTWSPIMSTVTAT